jgi:mRNA-degrading endonuclease toxin of MazEF toxin-antitoxin module
MIVRTLRRGFFLDFGLRGLRGRGSRGGRSAGSTRNSALLSPKVGSRRCPLAIVPLTHRTQRKAGSRAEN